MRKDIQDIVEEIVLSIDKTIKVSRVELAEELATKLFVCELKWLKEGSVIIDDQNRDATVTTIGENFITIQKSDPFIWTSKCFTIVEDIYFFRGTATQTNVEWGQFARKESGKTPFVWLVEPTQEKFFTNGQSNERESQLRLYFLDSTDYEKYTVKEHHDNVIKYLNAWIDGFFEAIEKNKRDFAKFDSYDARSLSIFGTETEQGYDMVILDSKLSAVEIRFTLPIKKGAKCLC